MAFWSSKPIASSFFQREKFLQELNRPVLLCVRRHGGGRIKAGSRQDMEEDEGVKERVHLRLALSETGQRQLGDSSDSKVVFQLWCSTGLARPIAT